MLLGLPFVARCAPSCFDMVAVRKNTEPSEEIRVGKWDHITCFKIVLVQVLVRVCPIEKIVCCVRAFFR